jgi:hypothetical protein
MSGYSFADLNSSAPDFLRMALELGAARCLRKPFTPDALLAAIRDCFAEHHAAAARLGYRVTVRDAGRARIRLRRVRVLLMSSAHRPNAAHAMPIAGDLIQLVRPLRIRRHWRNFFAPVVTLLSSHLPIAFRAEAPCRTCRKPQSRVRRIEDFSSISVLARRMKLTGP